MLHQWPTCGDALTRNEQYRCPACGADLAADETDKSSRDQR